MAGASFIGTAGWGIPVATAPGFPGPGTHLERYARVMNCAEINSSFHRPHRRVTYERWAAAVPAGFRFAVKLPRTITHGQKLRRARLPLERFLDESAGLGDRRGPLLVQLPPSLGFEPRVAARFFEVLRARHDGVVVCEPRHATWFLPAAEALLRRFAVARVAADPPPVPGADRPGGCDAVAYFRLHGSPRKYWSRYDHGAIASLAAAMSRAAGDTWCIFDNTASGAALENAVELAAALRSVPGPVERGR